MNRPKAIIPAERIQRAILIIRGQKVMLDRDLAELYGVETRALVQAVKRNLMRFPDDFMFQLSEEELENWRSQFVISNPSAKMAVRRKPYAFTEQGVAMLSSVLRELKTRHETLRQDVQAAIAQSERGESEPLDIEAIKVEGRERLAGRNDRCV